MEQQHLFLFGCCLSRLQEKLKELDKYLPESWQMKNDISKIMQKKGSSSVSKKPALTKIEMEEIQSN
jgi:hypothetical protein